MRPWLLAVCVGCQLSPQPPTIIERPAPTTTPPEPWVEPWIREGESGEIFIALKASTLYEPQTVSVSALFGENLRGAIYPSACAVGELCAVDLELEQSVALDASVSIDRSSWLGDTVWVGAFPLRFSVAEGGELGTYFYETPLDVSLAAALPFRFEDGEWGSATLNSGVITPNRLQDLWPDPDLPVEVGSRRFQEFRWRPGSGGQMWLTVRGNGLNFARPVADDGSALLDVSEVRWTEPLEVELWRVRTSIREIAGNQLVVHAASQQAWCVYDVCDGFPTPSWPVQISFDYQWTVNSGGSSQWTLFEDGRWEAPGSFGGSWSYDCCLQELRIVFPTGTEFWGTIDSNGCIDGQMRSWSGPSGTWSGFL